MWETPWEQAVLLVSVRPELTERKAQSTRTALALQSASVLPILLLGPVPADHSSEMLLSQLVEQALALALL